jgi:hypothetical protein
MPRCSRAIFWRIWLGIDGRRLLGGGPASSGRKPSSLPAFGGFEREVVYDGEF